MSITITHFSDAADNHNSVCIDLSTRPGNSMYELKTAKEEIVNEQTGRTSFKDAFDSISIKLEGRVSVVPSSHAYRAFHGDYAFGLNDLISNNFEKNPLPICVRYKSDQCVVIERPPFKITPNIRYGKRAFRRDVKYQKEPEIWIPWTIMFLTTNTSFLNPTDRTVITPYIFFRHAPLTSFDDLLSLPYTPNVFKDGRICLGESETLLHDAVNNKQFSYSDIAELYSFIAGEYFMGGWNLDLGITALASNHDEFFSAKKLSEIKKLAEKFENKYILSLFKEYGMGEDNPITSYGFNSGIRFYMNYLSFLDLDQILDYTSKLAAELKGSYNSYSRSIKPFTFGQVLAHHDDEFYRMNKDKYSEIQNYREHLNYYDEYDFVRHCASTGLNKTPVHTIKVQIIINKDDFLHFASDKILEMNWDVRSYELFRSERTEFYKKDIRFNLIKYENLLRVLIYDYIHKIQELHDSSLFDKTIHNTLKELDDFYRTDEALNTFKKTVVVDLSAFGMVLNEAFLIKDVLV